MEATKPPFAFNITIEIPVRRVQDLLTSAFEGGSNYWYRINKSHKPERFENYSWELKPEEEATKRKDHIFPHVDYPTNPGGYLIISATDCENDPDLQNKRLDLAQCQVGLRVMQEKYPRHFGNFMSENDDAETGDVFLQCCLFGDVVFG